MFWLIIIVVGRVRRILLRQSFALGTSAPLLLRQLLFDIDGFVELNECYEDAGSYWK